MSSEPTAVLYDVADGIATITLNRPDKRNALNDAIMTGLAAALRAAETDDAARVIVLTGAGKDFCAGADLSALEKIAKNDVLENLDDAETLMNLFLQMRRCPKPIVAVVRGRALAGGCGMASACDIIVAEETAQFGYPEVKIGFVPAMVMAILRRNISEKRAFEWMAVGEAISATKAEEWGFASKVFPVADFETNVGTYLKGLASRSASAMYLMKRLLYHMDGLGFENALRSGADINVVSRMTKDCQAGIAKFLQK